ncbi:MAG TPA: DUF305 domain-containing protein [Gemmatimonadales bacterium]|nr:DUF305 domain-containing protein [Gemmatimonadales bacterium]
MKQLSRTTAAVAVAVACAAGALRAQGAPAPARGTLAELEALYRARADSARMRFSRADVEFVTGMIAHHAQALIMAALAEGRGASPAVRVLCGRIINAQRDEIETMQTWLRERRQPLPEVHIEGLDLMLHGVDGSHARMPGMLTRAELEELERSYGREFDRLFLTYMIRHHQGAVTMVLDLFATDGGAQDEVVFKLASDIQVDQLTEIERMQLMLASLGPNPQR